MGVLDRLLLFIYSFLLTVLSLLGVITGVTVGLAVAVGKEEILQFVSTMYGNVWFGSGLISFSVLFFFLSLRFLWVSVKRNNMTSKGIDQENDLGSIHISLTTIEEIVISSAKRVKGVHDLTARVYFDVERSMLSIGLKMVIDGKIPIQSLSKELQEVVKNQVEKIAGVEVDQVSVYIAQTKKSSQNRLRVS